MTNRAWWFKTGWLGLDHKLYPTVNTFGEGNIFSLVTFVCYSWEVSSQRITYTVRETGREMGGHCTLWESCFSLFWHSFTKDHFWAITWDFCEPSECQWFLGSTITLLEFVPVRTCFRRTWLYILKNCVSLMKTKIFCENAFKGWRGKVRIKLAFYVYLKFNYFSFLCVIISCISF